MSCSTSSPTSSPGRVDAAGYTDLRPGHGCVFGTIDPEGSRLTDLAERAGMTKQTVGEVTSDLENLGYVARCSGRCQEPQSSVY
jgi:DNA-binding MarR family transcriptional regulator